MSNHKGSTVYLIRCQHGVFYVGESSHVKNRIDNHFNGAGAAATRKYKPVSHMELGRMESRRLAKKAETRLVKCLRKCGFKAFGGGYTQTASRRSRHS